MLNTESVCSRALSFIQSNANITNCRFSNGHAADNGGAINIIDSSTIAFYGVNFFENNTADVSGGALFAADSTVTFSGNNTFLSNRPGTFYTPTTLLEEVRSLSQKLS